MDFGRDDYNGYFNDIHDINGELREMPFEVSEPVFLIRGGDPVGPQLLMEYAKQISLSGTDPSVAKSAFSHALKMLEWQKLHGSKHVDLIRVPEQSILNKTRIEQIVEAIEVDGKLTSKVFDELIELFDNVYGPNMIRVCVPSELMACNEAPFYKPITESSALLELGVIENRIIILTNKL